MLCWYLLQDQQALHVQKSDSGVQLFRIRNTAYFFSTVIEYIILNMICCKRKMNIESVISTIVFTKESTYTYHEIDRIEH
jgi:hypothetical protein